MHHLRSRLGGSDYGDSRFGVFRGLDAANDFTWAPPEPGTGEKRRFRHIFVHKAIATHCLVYAESGIACVLGHYILSKYLISRYIF